ncbi:MAG TPA: HEAT repeat domain-containing protein [Isosphaeraceae bacterium]|jgi:HEAT repeat protein
MSKPTEDGNRLDAALPNELPPVEPPSAGFIIQLFVLPAVIVAVVIVVWLLFGKLAGGERDPMDYVRTIRQGNAHQSYRAAFELASLIRNDRRVAGDRRLLGELTAALNEALERPGDDPRLPQYLALTLGAFEASGAESADGRPADPIAALARALGPKQPVDVREAAAVSLAEQAARRQGALRDAGAVRALDEACAEGPPELRRRAAFALGFFGGEPAAEALRRRLSAAEEDRFVRYNAATALARQGDLAALDVAREMLTPGELEQVVPLESTLEKQHAVEQIQLEALRALDYSARHGRPDLARRLRTEVVALTKSGLVGVRTEAAAVLKLLPESR